MLVVIDRWEGRFAVVELPDQKMINLPVELLPAEAKEGDVIRIEIDLQETQRRKVRIRNLIDQVWQKE